jgi:hypothetical protein
MQDAVVALQESALNFNVGERETRRDTSPNVSPNRISRVQPAAWIEQHGFIARAHFERQ